jgi:tRNA-Thr(GGU) m(6)t(6)A37 methyltransferase TsaA
MDLQLRPVATVRSPLTDLASAPKQAHEGAPEAWLEFDPAVHDALDGLAVGDEVIVLTWLDRADREVLRVHPRGDVCNPMRGVFSTRSPARPNPVGLHELRILEIDGLRVRVSALEALDGTPVIDVKPVFKAV